MEPGESGIYFRLEFRAKVFGQDDDDKKALIEYSYLPVTFARLCEHTLDMGVPSELLRRR